MGSRVDGEWAGVEVEYPIKLPPFSFVIDLDKDTEDETDNVQPIRNMSLISS